MLQLVWLYHFFWDLYLKISVAWMVLLNCTTVIFKSILEQLVWVKWLIS